MGKEENMTGRYTDARVDVYTASFGAASVDPKCCSSSVTDKIAKKITLYGEKAYVNSEFQRFQSVVCWLHCFWV